MKKVFLLLMAVCLTVVASAQKVYFLYLQTEDQSPFYVRMGNKIYNSASSGYLILPNLTDTTYYLSVGFAKSSDQLAKFSVAINQNDRGFLIKKFDDGLALFDLEELSLVKANEASKDNTVYETKSDNFSTVLSKAAGDPSIVKVPVAKNEEAAKPKQEKEEVTVKAEETRPVENSIAENTDNTQTQKKVETKPTSETTLSKSEEKAGSTASQQTVADTETTQKPATKKEDIALQDISYKPSTVIRRTESSTTEGFGIVYHDKYGENTDTIRILIPASKVKINTEPEAVAANLQEKSEKSDALATEVKNSKQAKAENENISDKPFANGAGCKNIAKDKDFMKLRKKMAAEESDEAMIDEAKKDFKGRCYSVEQVKYLSTLFMTSAAKYQFFDAAYEHVSDKNNFASLEAEIKDAHYVKRFKALIGE